MMKLRLLSAIAFLCILVFSAYGQTVPQGINYQCIVRNNQTGNPVTNQTVTILFSIRSGSAGGPVDYQEKHVGSTNEFGLVNLVIGRGQPQLNSFSSIDWSAGAKFLTVLLETAPNVFDEIGSSELLSVPYALYAQNGGGGGTADNWGSQTAFTNNGITGNGLANNPIGLAQQGAQNGQVLKWNGTAWTPGADLQGSGNGGTVTQINTGTGLEGGPITGSGTISLSNTTVQPGTHGSATEIPVITVDAQGRITHIDKVVVQPGAVGINSGNGINVVTNGFNNFTINNTGDTNAGDDLTVNSVFDGDVSGTSSNLQLKANVVGANELNNGAVTAPKLASMGATGGQVLKWNGSAWAPADDNSGSINLTGGSGISISGVAPNLTITNTGDTNAGDDITTASQANGDVSGPFSNLQIKSSAVTTAEIADNAVTTAKIADGAVTTVKIVDAAVTSAKLAANAVTTTKIADGAVSTAKIADNAITSIKIADGNVGTVDLANEAVTAAKLDDMGAASGQVLKYNGTAWAPAADNTGNFTVLPGAGIDVTQSNNTFIVINSGDTDASDDLTNATNFNGDVSGTATNLQLKANIVTNADMAANSIGTNNLINGAVTAAKLNNMGALNGQILQYTNNAWTPVTLPNVNGDNWGNQTAQTNATLTGNGTNASPLGIAQQGATNGQVLRWNGTAWLPATPAGDNWGTQTAKVGTTLSGDGTNASPINLAQQGATNGQVLSWNGTSWVPFTLPAATGDNWGTQVVEVGNALNGKGTLADPLNLAQQGANAGEVLKWNGTQWVPSADNSGGTGDTYSAGPGISVTGAAPNFIINNIGDDDNDPANELQTISLVGNVLTLSDGGGSVNLPTGTTYTEGTGIDITGNVISNTGDLSTTNELQQLSIAGNVLSISNGNSVNLPAGTAYTEGAGIDITGTVISNTGDLSTTNELQQLSIAGNVLSISNGNSVNLPAGAAYTEGAGIDITGNVITNTGDLSDVNELQTLDLVGPKLSISNGNVVDLTSLISGTGDDWGNVNNHIYNLNTGNVLIGTNVNGQGKLHVVNGDATVDAGHFVQSGGNKAAVSGESAAGAGGYFSSDAGPAIVTNTGNVGIGTPLPAARIHVVGNGESVRLQGNTPSITFVPNGAGIGTPAFIRYEANTLVAGGNNATNIALMPNSFPSVVANAANGNVGIGAVNGSDARLRVLQKSGGILLENVNNNNFWEFSANPADGSLQLFNSTLGGGVPAGTFTAAGLYVPSDRRLKTDIQAVSSQILGKFMQLQPVTYRYTAENADAQRSLGFLAQDVQAVFPELVGQSTNRKGEKGFLSINYSGFGVLAVKAIQEQQQEIEKLQKENEALRAKTESLEARLLRLEQLIK